MTPDRSVLLVSVFVAWAALGMALIGAALNGITSAVPNDRFWSAAVMLLGAANTIPAVVLTAFVVAGREVVVVGPLRLTRRREVFGLGWTRTCEGPVSHVYNRGVRLSGPQNLLVFHAGRRVVRAGTGMTQQHAEAVVEELRNRYPGMRPEGFVPRHPRMP